MTSLQPLQCLNLDTVQQQAFVKYYNLLPEKPPTTVRIFDRNEYYSVHGIDATTSAKEVFSSISNIKKLGVEPNRLDYLVLSKGNFEILVKKLLLVKRYRVEIYVSCGSVRSGEWELRYKASPGCLEQLEDIIEGGLGTAQNSSCLMAVCMKGGRQIGVACISTADFTLSVSEFTDDELLTQLETVTVQMSPNECVVASTENEEYKALKKVMERANVTVTNMKKSDFSTEGLIQDLNRLLKFKDSQQQDANVFVETRLDVAMSSVAAGVKYMSLMTDQAHFGRYRLETIQTETFLHVDASAMAALNVFPEAGDTSGAPSRSLYGLLDRCRTQHGKRLLAQWLRQPLRDINLINERLDIVEALVNNSQVRLQLYEEHLRKLPDLQALARRLTRKKANLHDCYRIYQALKRLPQLLQCMSEADSPTIHSALTEPIAELASDLEKFQLMIESTLDLDAVDRGDYLVKPSFDENLSLASETLEETREAAQTELNKAARDLGLDAAKTIKLEVNPQTGYFFRVTLKEEQNLRKKKKYIIVDAVKGGVRFKTTQLDRINEDYIQTMKVYGLEQEKVVGEIVAIAAGYSDCLLCLSHLLSRVDVLVSFSMGAVNAPEPYVRPEIVESLDEFILEGARHPCLEIMEGVSYIANDVKFERGKCVMQIVTGPNMGGKSTWMRSAGVSTLLAHVGSYVPCVRAVVPRLKAICARVGAADNELCAQSTFMREMLDTAAILRIATPDSLVLIDELGRGTSTYEGCGLAWAIAEELATKSKSFTLFATHYHELTRLASLHRSAIVNRHAAATYQGGSLVLYRRIEEGASANSLGLQLARAANLPEALLKYAEEKQAELETNLFGTENENTSEGQQILVDFLTKCKEIEATTTSDNEVMTKIQDLRDELLKIDNKYVKAFMV